MFLAALLETVPVFGAFVPGSTVILSLSALIPNSDLHLAAVLTSAIGGALLGDGAAYWLGRHEPGRIRSLWPLRDHPAVVSRSEALFHTYGSSAVFIARFLPPIRAFIPITAGALGMPPGRFVPINVAAILCWAMAHVMPGVLAGEAFGRAAAWAGHLIVPLLVGIVTTGLLVWAIGHWHRAARA